MTMQIEIHDPRPDDMAELARLTAMELRKPSRGIWALAFDRVACVNVARFDVLPVAGSGVPVSTWIYTYCIYESRFDNLGPVGCADVIQAEESRRAREWAGDP